MTVQVTAAGDLADRRRTEEALQQQVRRAEVLLELPTLAERYDERSFLQRGMELAEDLTGSAISFIHFVEDGGEKIELVAWSRRTLEHYCTAAYDSHYPVSQAGIWADALRRRAPVIFNDYPRYPHKHGLPEGHSALHRLISVPVLEDGQVVMLAGVGNKPTDYSAFDAESVQLIATAIWQIAQKARADARLRLLTRAVEQSDVSIVVTDADGNIQYGNPHFERTSGYTLAEAIGKNPRILQSGATPPETYETLWGTVLAGHEWRGELLNRRKDGTTYWERAVISPVRDARGVITNFVAVKEDITERRQMEEQRSKLQTQLEHAQKMQSVGRLAGGIAHDFNNLLTVISASVELAMSSHASAEALHDDLTVVQEATRRAMALTRQLLTFSRQNVIESRDVAVNDVVARILGLLDRMVGDDVSIVADLAADAGVVRVDVGQLEQVITNLAVNARDAMPRGGRIVVSTARVHLTEGEIGALTAGDYTRLTVSDTGVGMTSEVMERVFDPFFTTKPVGQGTGLGLAIVYGVVTRSGGAVTLESSEGSGTAVHVFLPRREPGDVVPDVKARDVLVPGHGRVLVVDDEAALGRVAQRVLQRAGYAVLLASSGAEALRLVEQTSEPIDLLLSDVIMPDMSGPELAAKLRARDPLLRVLFVSGYSGDILSDHGLDEQHYGFIAKPFSIPDLTRKVQEALAE